MIAYHDVPHLGQPEPGMVPSSLPGEEGLENPWLRFSWNAGSVVLDENAATFGGANRPHGYDGLTGMDVPARDRLQRVRHQVDDGARHADWIDDRQRQIGVEVELELLDWRRARSAGSSEVRELG